MEKVQAVIGWVQNEYYHDKLNWDVALGAIVLMGAYALLHPYLSWNTQTWSVYDLIPRRRGKAMRRARRNYVRSLAIDSFVHDVEELVYNGTFTREEAKEIYRDMKKCFPVSDLYPNVQLLKENINKRRASGIHAPVVLPDGEQKPIRRHLFDKPVKA